MRWMSANRFWGHAVGAAMHGAKYFIAPCITATGVLSKRFRARARSSLSSVVAHAVLALHLVLLGAPQTAFAEGAIFQSAKLEATEDGYQLNAQLDLTLTPAMEEAVRKGVSLFFAVEFEVSRGRWYWLDQVVVRERRNIRVTFAPLTDQYRITVSGLSQNVATFDDVKRVLSRVRSWNVIDRGRLKFGEKYEAAVRFKLDTAQLPKPFQLNVLASKEWSLDSDWMRWTITGGDIK